MLSKLTSTRRCASPDCPTVSSQTHDSTTELRLCSQCRCVRYCSKKCQKDHWTHHKRSCKETHAVLKSLGNLREFRRTKKSQTHNLNQVIGMMEKEATKGDADSMYKLGLLFAHSMLGTPQNHSEAVKLFGLAADKGHAGAQFELARCYCQGTGVSQNHEEARRLYRMAADQNFTLAQLNLAVYYEKGLGGDQDKKKAFEYCRNAARKNDPRGLYALAVYYENGTGVKRDLQKAREYYESAATLGNAKAQHNLGAWYEHGKGVAKNDNQAVSYYTLAATNGLCISQFHLGVIYYKGRLGQPRDTAKATKYFTLAAKQGDKDAKSWLEL